MKSISQIKHSNFPRHFFRIIESRVGRDIHTIESVYPYNNTLNLAEREFMRFSSTVRTEIPLTPSLLLFFPIPSRQFCYVTSIIFSCKKIYGLQSYYLDLITTSLCIYDRARHSYAKKTVQFILLVQCLLIASIYLHLVLEVNITTHKSLAIDQFRCIKIQHGSEAQNTQTKEIE